MLAKRRGEWSIEDRADGVQLQNLITAGTRSSPRFRETDTGLLCRQHRWYLPRLQPADSLLMLPLLEPLWRPRPTPLDHPDKKAHARLDRLLLDVLARVGL